MKPFTLITRLEPTPDFGLGVWRFRTEIQTPDGDLGTSVVVSEEVLEIERVDYVIEQHLLSLKRYLNTRSKDRLFRDSPEYREMKRQLEAAESRLADIDDIVNEENPR